MSQITVSDLTFCYEGSYDNIFEGVSFVLDTDWKLGFIGRNGKGKTTLLRLLMGNAEKYAYQGSIRASVAFDYFPYTVTREQEALPAAELFEALRPDFELWRVLCELEQLALDPECLYRSFSTLSHGERTKAMLALLFSQENFFLLVDEPTNHLDSRARKVVQDYLRTKKGFILVSHDRELLDACIDHVLVLNRETIQVEKGNFSTWWENKERQDSFHRSENEKHLREIGKLKEAADRAAGWADKNERTKIGYDPIKDHDRGIDARAYIGAKTKKMQSRISQMERSARSAEDAGPGGMFSADESGLRNEGCHTALRNFDFILRRGERILLKGENGCGKSSLIRAVLAAAGAPEMTDISEGRGRDTTFCPGTREVLPQITSGVLEVPAGLKISYVNQDTGFLKGSLSEFARGRGLEESLLLSLLRQLDFDRIQFRKEMEEYSEGQKKKVLLAASLLTPAHLYIWDEPLNYIDIFSRMQLEELILKYRPTMLLVEHDGVFGEKVASRIVSMCGEKEAALPD